MDRSASAWTNNASVFVASAPSVEKQVAGLEHFVLYPLVIFQTFANFVQETQKVFSEDS
jgi:hypothetical protein